MPYHAGNPPLGGDVDGVVWWAHGEFVRVSEAITLLELTGTGTGVPPERAILTINSVQGGGDLSADRTIDLVGDVAAPGASMLYGTNAVGARGWYPQPSGGAGGTVGEAPIDGQDYWRNAGVWVVGNWASLDGKPTTFPPTVHQHSHAGLLDLTTGDDHPQYHNNARGDVRYAPIAHVGSVGSANHGVFTAIAAGFVPPAPSPQGYVLNDGGAWVPRVIGASGAVEANFRFDTATSGASDPGAGDIRLNNVVQNSATIMSVSDETVNGVPIAQFWFTLRPGDFVMVVKTAGPDGGKVFKVNGTPTMNGVAPNQWILVPIEAPAYASTGADFANNGVIQVGLIYSPDSRLPTGGTTGQVLTKTSALDYAANWQTPAAFPTSLPPIGPAGGVLSGTYPSPGFAVDMATQAELNAVAAAKADVGHNHDGSYVRLVGDTMTGPLYITGALPNLLVGATASVLVQNIASSAQMASAVQNQGTTNPTGSTVTMLFNASAANSPSLVLARGRGSVLGTIVATAINDYIGIVSFQGGDASAPPIFRRGAEIASVIEGAPGAGIVRAGLRFFTADDAGTMTERMKLTMDGSLGIGPANLAAGITVGRSLRGGVAAYAFLFNAAVEPEVTTAAYGFLSQPAFSIAGTPVGTPYVIGSMRHFFANQPAAPHADCTITNQFGIYVNANLTRAVSNYGVYSALPIGPNSNWNIFAAGLAPNVLNGKTRVGSGLDPVASLDVTGDLWVADNSTDYALSVTQAGAGPVAFFKGLTGPTYTIDNAGRLVGGNATAINLPASGGVVVTQFHGLTSTFANFSIAQCGWANSTNGPGMYFGKSRSGVVGTYGGTVLGINDYLMNLRACADDGTTFVQAASVNVQMDAAAAAGVVPSNFNISITNTAGALGEAFRLLSQNFMMAVRAGAAAAIAAAATLTAVNLATGILNCTGTTYTLTLALGTDMDLGFNMANNTGFDWSLINAASGVITLAANTGHTIVGGTTIAAGTSARWRTRKSTANTFVTYRIA